MEGGRLFRRRDGLESLSRMSNNPWGYINGSHSKALMAAFWKSENYQLLNIIHLLSRKIILICIVFKRILYASIPNNNGTSLAFYAFILIRDH